MHTQPVIAVILGSLLASATFGLSARIAHADSVYKCRNADGAIAFQDHACASGAAESQVEIAPAPPVAPSPDYGRDARDTRRYAHAAASRTAHAPHEALSYECRAANGEVFYRHGACPGRITASDAGTGKRGRGSASGSFGVTSEALPRGEVCRRIAAAGSIGRAGHVRDESVSTYDRNLGRDPCRFY